VDFHSCPTREVIVTTPIYEFRAWLRIHAGDGEEAHRRAEAIAEAVSHGEATLILEDADPFPCAVEDEDD
jgi:hypothetical protein